MAGLRSALELQGPSDVFIWEATLFGNTLAISTGLIKTNKTGTTSRGYT